jgi:hypothetical protein
MSFFMVIEILAEIRRTASSMWHLRTRRTRSCHDAELRETRVGLDRAARAGHGMRRRGGRAPVTQLHSVRAYGIAYEDEEAVLGDCGVAAPLREPGGNAAGAIRLPAAGAIGLVVPSTQWPLDNAAITDCEPPRG